MRSRAVAVVIRSGHLLVIGRRKQGREYAVLPGGGIEDGENAVETCLRELREETGLEGSAPQLLDVVVAGASGDRYVAVTVQDDALRLGGPELERVGAENVYRPQWVPLEQVDHIGLVPDAARRAVSIAGRRRRGPRRDGAEPGGGISPADAGSVRRRRTPRPAHPGPGSSTARR